MHPLRQLRPSPFAFALLLACTAALTGCGDDDDSGDNPAGAAGQAGTGGSSGGSGAGGAGGAGGGMVVQPKLSELPADTFTFIKTGGQTRCAKGAEYGFYVRPGATDKVVIDFSGGGACWNDLSCGLSENVKIFDDTVQAAPTPVGIYDHGKAENPIADWTHVFVPYCTGDVHWGDNVKTYDGGVTLNHVGAVNARAVLDWVYGEFQVPQRVFVTGCSAGSYGSILWSAHVREHYKDSPTAVAQFGDAGAGISPDTFFPETATSWKPQGAFPPWANDFAQYTKLSEMYVAIADHNPSSLFSQMTTRVDQTQITFYTFMDVNGSADIWSQKMLASYDEIEAATDNFASYVTDGDVHCSINKDAFYTIADNGSKLSDWVRTLTEGELPTSVRCPNCGPAPSARGH